MKPTFEGGGWSTSRCSAPLCVLRSAPDSDVDLFVELSPDVADDFFAYAGIAADLEAIVGRDVDVARRDRLRAHVRPSAEAQAVYAF